MDLSTLSYTELKSLRQDIERELVGREQEEKRVAREKILELAREHGLNVEEILSKPVKTRRPVEAKYRNPVNQADTWTGRGRKPRWVELALAQGKSLDDLLI